MTPAAAIIMKKELNIVLLVSLCLIVLNFTIGTEGRRQHYNRRRNLGRLDWLDWLDEIGGGEGKGGKKGGRGGGRGKKGHDDCYSSGKSGKGKSSKSAKKKGHSDDDPCDPAPPSEDPNRPCRECSDGTTCVMEGTCCPDETMCGGTCHLGLRECCEESGSPIFWSDLKDLTCCNGEAVEVPCGDCNAVRECLTAEGNPLSPERVCVVLLVTMRFVVPTKPIVMVRVPDKVCPEDCCPDDDDGCEQQGTRFLRARDVVGLEHMWTT